MKKKPVVAVVGRPNVGKSTLFNVLAGDMISIVKDTPGVTRDRIYADCTWLDHAFTLIDTGGIEPDTKDIILSQMREQAEIAIATADVIIFITDVRQGLVDSDSKVADMLRRSHKPVVLVVNKVDSFQKYMADVYEFYNLGIGDPVPVSASSRLGIGEHLSPAHIGVCVHKSSGHCENIYKHHRIFADADFLFHNITDSNCSTSPHIFLLLKTTKIIIGVTGEM